jgi:hypothetical protein
MTSGLGFEALIRGVPVTTLGAPFYAGWGLTTDLGEVPPRRRARPSLPALVHATLVAYPRYHDPVTGLPCPVEVAVERLAEDSPLPRSRSPRTPRDAARLERTDREGFQKTVISAINSQLIHRHSRNLLSNLRQFVRICGSLAKSRSQDVRTSSPSVRHRLVAGPAPPTGGHAHRADRRRALRPDARPPSPATACPPDPPPDSAAASVPPPSQKTRVSPPRPAPPTPPSRPDARPAGGHFDQPRPGRPPMPRAPPPTPPARGSARPEPPAPCAPGAPPAAGPAAATAPRAPAAAPSPKPRTVSIGSSPRAVPAPTITASWLARCPCTQCRARGSRDPAAFPVAVAIRPSSVAASFRLRIGRPATTATGTPHDRAAPRPPAPVATSIPAARSVAMPAPAVRGSGSPSPPRHARPRRDQRAAAGRRLAGVVAGLQCHVNRRAARRIAGLIQRHALRMGPPAILRPAAPDHAALLHDDASHSGVRPDPAQPAPPQRRRGP